MQIAAGQDPSPGPFNFTHVVVEASGITKAPRSIAGLPARS